MKKIINWFKNNRDVVIRNVFLLPILLVVIMSISHVVSWYDLGNPVSWAIYLSVAIEIFALASVAAASTKASRTSVWFLFGLVTFIQIIGNIFFEYKDIDINGPNFLSWVEMISPAFTDWDLTDHRRFLAVIQGGTLPLMSLTALHYYIKYNDRIVIKKEADQTSVRSSGTVGVTHETENDLEKIETELEEIRDLQEDTKVEAIDEDLFLKESMPKSETVNLQTKHNSEINEKIEELSSQDVFEKDSDESEGKNIGFGPPHINNQGQIS